MSNYLNNLVLRNQQAIEVVRPRLGNAGERLRMVRAGPDVAGGGGAASRRERGPPGLELGTRAA